MTVVVVTDSTASLPPEHAEERGIVVVPLQVVIGRRCYDEGPRGRPRSSWRRRCADFVPGQHVAAHPGRDGRGLRAAGAARARRDHLDPPVGRDERDLRVGAARGRQVDGAGHVHRHPAGRVRRRATPPCRPPTSLDAGGIGGGGGRRPPASGRRRRRRCSTSTPSSTSAVAAGSVPPPRSSGARWRSSRCWASRTARSPTSRRCGPARRRSAGSRTSRSRPRASSRSTCTSPTSPTPSGPSSWRRSCGDRLAENLEGREIWCGELGAVLGAHVGPGMVAVCVAPAPRLTGHSRRFLWMSGCAGVVHRLRSPGGGCPCRFLGSTHAPTSPAEHHQRRARRGRVAPPRDAQRRARRGAGRPAGARTGTPRCAAWTPPPSLPPGRPVDVPVVPVPGRHASRAGWSATWRRGST